MADGRLRELTTIQSADRTLQVVHKTPEEYLQ
jgi:hypothetical protein